MINNNKLYRFVQFNFVDFGDVAKSNEFTYYDTLPQYKV